MYRGLAVARAYTVPQATLLHEAVDELPNEPNQTNTNNNVTAPWGSRELHNNNYMVILRVWQIKC